MTPTAINHLPIEPFSPELGVVAGDSDGGGGGIGPDGVASGGVGTGGV